MREICLVGGDARMEFAAQALGERGYKVSRIAPSDMQAHAARGCLLVGGGLPQGNGYADYLKDEAFLYENARITAEGALMLLGKSTPGTVYGMDVGVIGMGRIAECLCPLLRALGARVTVYARRPEALSRARTAGVEAVRFSGVLPRQVVAHDAICNTVPHVLFDRALLSDMPRDCLLLELASAPGGFDANALRELGLTLIPGQGLPGKYAPRAAGELIAAYAQRMHEGEGEI